MDGGAGAELLSPGEAEWPPELRLPPPPPMPEPPGPPPPPAPATASLRGWNSPAPHLQPPAAAAAAAAAAAPKRKEPSPPRHPEGFDDQQFLGSIMAPPAAPPQQQQHQQQPAAAPAPVKRKRGRPPKNRDGAAGAAAAPARPAAKKEEEIVCFICFDGGNLVVCDRRGCPKVYHPACIKRDESFFRARGKWDCGWHICSSCEKAVQYMCYTCTYSVCKGCVKPGKFFGVRGNKGFCDTCYGTILLIESKDDGAKVSVDFDDKNSWEYLFKLYWLDLKGKHLLTLEELINAKSQWTVPTPAGRREKEESSDELYDANKDDDASFDISSRKRRRNNSTGKRGQKRKKDSGVTASKCEISSKSAGSLPNRSSEGMVLPGDTKWASPELLEFIGHMRNGDSSYISQFDVQVLLLEYINQNNLRDPRKKSQIICDARLTNLFRKPRVAHFEMLKLLEMHYVAKQTPTANTDGQRAIHPDSAQVDNGGYDELTDKVGSDKRRKAQKKNERDLTTNPEEYAAIDMHNINLIYLRRSLMEDLIDDDAALSDKIAGAFVRIRISGLGQKQDMYRLVKVLGTHKVAERYSVGKKTTDCALEILNLDKREVITMDTISNQDFTEEECKRLRQSMKFGLTTRLKLGDIYEKAKVFQSLRVKDWLENEKQRLSHLRDRASETGRRKQLRECVEKLQVLNTPEERARMISEVPEVHVDPHMAPDYESAEEQDYKKAVDWTINRNGQHQNHILKCLDAPVDTGGLRLPAEGVTHRSGAGDDIKLNNTVFEAASLPSSGAVTIDTEPEKVWHYKDPKGVVQGPFTLSQLSNWTGYFPRDLRIWLTFESEERSLLLTEVLRKQQKDFVQPTSVTTSEKLILSSIGKDRVNSNLVAKNASPPIGYDMVSSSALPSQSIECSEKTKMDPKVLGGTFTSRSLKDDHTAQGQEQHQINYTCTISGSHEPPGSYDVWVPREPVGKLNSCQDMNHSFESNVEQHPDQESLGHLKSQMDSGAQKVSVLTPQQSERHPATSLSPTPSELKTVGQQEASCWSSATNAGTHDLQLSISLAKPESCLSTRPVEVKGLSSASALLSQSGDPACVSHPVPSLSTLNSIKTVEPMNQHKPCHPDARDEPFDQHRKPRGDPVLSSKTQDLECEYPSPTPKLERKDSSMNHSGSTTLAPEALPEKTCVHSSVSSVAQASCTPACKVDSVQSPKETSCLEERHLRDSDSIAQTEHLNEGSVVVKKDNKVVNAVSDAEGIAVSDVLESLTGQDCEKYCINGAAPSETFLPAPAEEEQPQCSSPIALSPWGDPSYYQGEAVDSALWDVQDDPSNVMWSMPSPTPALHTSGLGADGKHSSCIIEEVIATRGDTVFGETLPTQGEKKMEQGKSCTSTDSGVPEQVKPKPSATSGMQDRRTKASDWKPPALSLEGIAHANASGWPPSGSTTQGSAKASDWQRLSSPSDWSRKASGWRLSGSSTDGSAKASPDGSRKASGWQRSSSPPDGSKKASARQPSGSSADRIAKASGSQQPSTSPAGCRKASGWQRPGSTQGSAKVDGWQQTSSSPEGNRKAPGWHASGRESSKVNSIPSANENRRPSSGHQATTPTGKHSSEVPKRQGNGDKNTSGWEEAAVNSSGVSKKHGSRDKNDGWGEALGNNKSWHTSSGNASRGSQGSHHHQDRHSYGSDSRRGSSHHSWRPDHHRHDHGNGSTPRSSSRGQPQNGICKYFNNGYCRKGSNCQYIHRGSSR